MFAPLSNRRASNSPPTEECGQSLGADFHRLPPMISARFFPQPVEEMMRCVILFLVLLFAASPVRADWQFSKWGMPADAFAKTASKQKDVSDVNLRGEGIDFLYDIGMFRMEGTAYFKDGGLSSIWLRSDSQSCMHLFPSLVSKYGKPDADLGGVYKWMKRKAGDISFATGTCSLRYSRPSTTNGKL